MVERFRSTDYYNREKREDQRGTVLVSIIITMIILSVLGAAMFSLFSTSIMSQIGGNSSARAYYLAEAGFRYADSEVANTSQSMRESKLESLHNKEFIFLDDNGRFHLNVYPYYYKTTADPAGNSILNTKVPGGFPSNMTLSSGYLKINDKIYQYSSASRIDENVTFTIASGTWSSIDVGTTVLAASRPDGNQTVNNTTNYIDLETVTGSASSFPEMNGTFRIDGVAGVWTYTKRTDHRLEGVAPINDPEWNVTSSLAVSGMDYLILDKFAKIHSTGIVYYGDTLETRREIVYYAPLSTSYEIAYHETFDDKSHWSESILGTHEIRSIGGDSALKVTGTSSATGAPKASLIAFNWASTAINLATARDFAGGYVSYDSQVKVGFEADPYPVQGYYPVVPIPSYYVAGISFRLDNNSNSYGLSFMRGDNSLATPYDNIPNEIVPDAQNGKTSIVLWRQTDSGNTRTWLAYKDISSRNFADDAESGEDGWTVETSDEISQWHITENRSQSASHAWYYGREGTWDFDTGARTYGYLISPDINLCGFSDAKVSFWSWHETEPFDPANPTFVNIYDVKFIDISTNGGTTWTALFQLTHPENPMGVWEYIEVPLTSYVGQTIKIRFRFDTGNSLNNTYEGWYVDDILISGDFQFPVNEATLMVRITEAATVSFSSGGTTAIEEGDIVRQSNGATGTVIGAPILSSGSWAGDDAAGIILLNNLPRDSEGSITTPFVAGALSVAGKGTDLATVTAFRERDNYIRTYYTDTNGCGMPNDDPLDYEKRANARGAVNWPPDNVDGWSAENDYFTLIQWDAFNTGVDTITSVSEPNAIIRNDTLTTPTPYEQPPELGLHTFGHGSTNVFFDDFALQAEIWAKRTGFLPSIQQ